MYGTKSSQQFETNKIPMTDSEKLGISRDLEQFHRIFDVFWSLSDIYFVVKNRMKTACVALPRNAKARMYINREFWDSLNSDEKLFVIIHECLHVMLDHGMRNARNMPGATPRLINVAQDITINEMIVDMFGFNRGLMANWKKYCWIETCFADPASIQRNQVFEYYLKKLIENPTTMDAFDDHGELSDEDDIGGDADDDDVTPDHLANELAKHMTWDELMAMIKSLGKEDGRGIGLSPFQVVLEAMTPEPLNFNKIVEGLKRNSKAKMEKIEDTWTAEQRRFNALGRTLILPGHVEVNPKPKKLIAAVFFDVSGSCSSYFKYFNQLMAAFNAEKELFELRAYFFDTKCTEVDPKKAMQIGGGTAFDIIEVECRKIEIEDGKYPDFVGVVTDGAGNRVAPKFPGRWVWLLTQGATHQYIHSASKWFPIKSVTF